MAPGSPPIAAPSTEKADTLQRDVERLAERIRAAHMKKDMNLFISCYASAYPNLGELERQTYENWKSFDFKNVSYNISNLRRVGPNQAAAELVWNFQLLNNQTKASEMHRAVFNVMLEESGGAWKIRESKEDRLIPMAFTSIQYLSPKCRLITALVCCLLFFLAIGCSQKVGWKPPDEPRTTAPPPEAPPASVAYQVTLCRCGPVESPGLPRHGLPQN